MSCPSAPAPLQLQFSNQTVSSDGLARTYGVALQVGTPSQILALAPSLLLNNTYLNNLASCGTDPTDTCLSTIGGGYNSKASSTYVATTADAWNGSAESNADAFIGQPALYFNDVLRISSSQFLSGFPFLIQASSDFAGALGVGLGSTYLNGLYNDGIVPSRSFSLFTGIYSSLSAGTFIIGGYADRFYTGELYSQTNPNSSYCTSCFDVVGMDYITSSGTVSLWSSNSPEPIHAMLEPYYTTMVVPDEVFYKFGNATGGTIDSDINAHSYPVGSVPTGNITVTLANGLKTIIPSNAIFDPPAFDGGMSADGRNDSVVYGMLQPWSVVTTDPSDNYGIFGIPYTAFVYIILDYEDSTISIANANHDAEVAHGDIITICPQKGQSSGGRNIDAIAGGAVGGVVGLVLIFGLAWFSWRRMKQSRAISQKDFDAKNTVADKKSDGRAQTRIPSAVTIQDQTRQDPGSPIKEANASITEQVTAEAVVKPQEMASDRSTQLSELPSRNVARAELPA